VRVFDGERWTVLTAEDMGLGGVSETGRGSVEDRSRPRTGSERSRRPPLHYPGL